MALSMVTRCAPLLLLLLVGCADEGDDDASPVYPPPASGDGTPFALEGLSAGPHGGIIVGFEPLDGDGIERAVRAEARQAGMSVSRVQADWAELEPAPGVYDEPTLRSLLAEAVPADEGLLFTLSTLDTGRNGRRGRAERDALRSGKPRSAGGRAGYGPRPPTDRAGFHVPSSVRAASRRTAIGAAAPVSLSACRARLSAVTPAEANALPSALADAPRVVTVLVEPGERRCAVRHFRCSPSSCPSCSAPLPLPASRRAS